MNESTHVRKTPRVQTWHFYVTLLLLLSLLLNQNGCKATDFLCVLCFGYVHVISFANIAIRHVECDPTSIRAVNLERGMFLPLSQVFLLGLLSSLLTTSLAVAPQDEQQPDAIHNEHQQLQGSTVSRESRQGQRWTANQPEPNPGLQGPDSYHNELQQLPRLTLHIDDSLRQTRLAPQDGGASGRRSSGDQYGGPHDGERLPVSHVSPPQLRQDHSLPSEEHPNLDPPVSDRHESPRPTQDLVNATPSQRRPRPRISGLLSCFGVHCTRPTVSEETDWQPQLGSTRAERAVVSRHEQVTHSLPGVTSSQAAGIERWFDGENATPLPQHPPETGSSLTHFHLASQHLLREQQLLQDQNLPIKAPPASPRLKETSPLSHSKASSQP